MTEHSLSISLPEPMRHVFNVEKGKLAVAYLAILLIPFLVTLSLNLDDKGLYSGIM